MKEQYIKQVEKELSLPRKMKKEVVRDLNEVLRLLWSMEKQSSRLSSVWGRQKNLQTAPQNSLALITPNRKKGTVSFLLLLRLLSRLLPFRYMLLRNQEKCQKEQSDKPTRQQIYRLRARLPLIFRKSFWLLGLQQQLLLFC